MNTKQRFIFIVVSILIVVFSGFFAWKYAHHNANPTNNTAPIATNKTLFSPREQWLHYENKDLGIYFDYPPELEFVEGESGKYDSFSAYLNPYGQEFYEEGTSTVLIGMSHQS